MRTPEEVEAAAGRLRRLKAGEGYFAVYPPPIIYGPDPSMPQCKDEATLADAWLADHPAEDSLPVAATWLSAAVEEPPGYQGWWKWAVGPLTLRVWQAGECWAVALWHDDTLTGTLLPAVETRGQLRRLLDALGATLPTERGAPCPE